MELCIDTSTRYASVVISHQGDPQWETCWFSKRNHTVELAPTIQMLLGKAGASPSDLEAVFLAVGPGGFSALRVGMSAAKGMAEGLDIPLVGVGTLELEAFPYAETGRSLYPLLDVGRGEVAWAVYRQDDGEWRQVRAPEIASPEVVVAGASPEAMYCGEGAWTHKDLLRERADPSALVLAVPPPTRRCQALARLGFLRLAEGAGADRDRLQPMYLRRPSITPRSPKRAKTGL